MRQRNDTGHPLTAHTDPPQVIEPEQTIDYPVYIVGLTVLEDEPPRAVAVELSGQAESQDAADQAAPATQSPARPSGRARRTDNAQEG